MINKSLIAVFFFIIFTQVTFANNYLEKTIDGYKFRVIKYNTLSPDYIFKIGANPDYKATNLRELMEANNGISAVNGVFFCPASYKECGGKNFTKNERYVDGIKIGPEASTGNRVVFGVDKNDKAFLYQTDKINRLDEDKINYGFANFPLLLQNGVSKIKDYSDLGLIDSKMKAKIQRNFICSDKLNRNIYTGYVSAIELEKLPELLIKFGCNDALNLDAGGSSAMIYNSRYIIGPGRDIMDGVIIERKGLDTAKIRENSKKIRSIIETRIANKSLDEKIIFLDNIQNGLTKIRVKIYNQNSIDIYEEGKKIGYEINVKNLKKLQTTYMINYLNKSFNELKLEYIDKENQKKEAERQRVENENRLKNSSDLLF